MYANPHSGAESSQSSSARIEETRLALLQYFKASPEEFDVVFVANATAAVKLVAEAFRDSAAGFDYAYHRDCHTSLVGVRQLSKTSRCVATEEELERWLAQQSRLTSRRRRPRLIAIPGQSNLTGFRPNLGMCNPKKHSSRSGARVYTLLDAAALVSTSPLDLSNAHDAPDFTALSIYKIFGYPDLGALLVKKSSSDVLRGKKYFGGGTVDMVTIDKAWHVKKEHLHEALEEGTLPFHNTIALGHALDVHQKLYGSPSNVSRHARYLAETARTQLGRLTHSNRREVCHIYCSDVTNQGPIVTFNLADTDGRLFRTYVVESLAIKHNIALRVGGMCNPGGIQNALSISYSEMKHNYDAGVRCGDDSDLPDSFHGAIGMVRVSFGAMSSRADVDGFLNFIKANFVDQDVFDTVFQQGTKQAVAVPPSISSDEKVTAALHDTIDRGGEKPEHRAAFRSWLNFRFAVSCFGLRAHSSTSKRVTAS